MVLWSSSGEGLQGAFEKADARTGRSAGLSKESAGEDSNLMRWPAQQRNRNATSSACVGWDAANIENRPAFRKQAQSPGVLSALPNSEWLNNHQHDDPDH